MQAQQAGIHLREKVFAQKEKQSEREQAESQKTNHEQAAILDRGFQQGLIASPEASNLRSKPR